MSLKVSRQRILDGATVVMVACALFLTSLVVRREFTTRNPASLINEVSDWKQYATAGHSLGPDDAAVTIVEFCGFRMHVLSTAIFVPRFAAGAANQYKSRLSSLPYS